MRKILSLTPHTILQIDQPEDLFSRGHAEAKCEYHALAQRWHPDTNRSSEAAPVFSHIVHLYGMAKTKLSDGTWVEPADKVEDRIDGRRRFKLWDGTLRELSFLALKRFELGTMFIADDYVAYEVDNEFRDLFLSGRDQIRKLPFADSAMAAEMSRYLPQPIDSFRTAASSIIVIRKTPDQLLLSDVLEHFGSTLPSAEPVGWILNSLLNICCYLQWAQLAHNSFAADTVFISPLRHTSALLGGWWYSKRIGDRLTALPDYALDLLCGSASGRTASAKFDLECIKAIGRQLLGDRDGASLRHRTDVPSPLVDWLCLPGDDCAGAEYAAFKYCVLADSFGAPRFVDLRISKTDLYKEK